MGRADIWSFKYRETVSAYMESFSAFWRERGLDDRDKFDLEDLYQFALCRADLYQTSGDNVAGLFGVLCRHLMDTRRLYEVAWGQQILKNMGNYLIAFCNNWAPQKAKVFSLHAFRKLNEYEQLVILTFLQTGYRDSSIEAIQAGDIWTTYDDNQQKLIRVNTSHSKTWAAYEKSLGAEFPYEATYVSIGCNCDDKYGDEFCLVCNPKRNPKLLDLPSRSGTISKITRVMGATPHSLRRTLIMSIMIQYFAKRNTALCTASLTRDSSLRSLFGCSRGRTQLNHALVPGLS